MAEWLHFEIPDSLVGERKEQKSQYVTTYQTEILLPEKSEYAGYHFWHPSKLVSGLADEISRVTYNPTFTFTLIKKEREPGKRYKRYKLSAEELVAVYRAEMAKVAARKEKKEAARRAQEGAVEVVAWLGSSIPDKRRVLFRYRKKYFTGSGAFFCSEAHVHRHFVIAEAVPRGVFEDICEKLDELARLYQVVDDVRGAIGKSVMAEREVADSFEALCDSWDAAFCEKAASVIRNAMHLKLLGLGVADAVNAAEGATLCKEVECAPPFGDVEDCEFYRDGICIARPFKAGALSDEALE